MKSPRRDLYYGDPIPELIESITQRATRQPIPIRMAWDDNTNFAMVCATAVYRLCQDIEAGNFDITFIRDYMNSYYGTRGEPELKRLYVAPAMDADINSIDEFIKKHYAGEIDQWVMRGDLFAKRGGKVNLSFIIPMAIMWLEQQTIALESKKS